MRILCVFAHPDDEVIFGWPVLQKGASHGEMHVIHLCGNGHKGVDPVLAAEEVCKASGAFYHGSMFKSNQFYRLPTRNSMVVLRGCLDMFTDSLLAIIANINPDFIFTHNPMGEYGHGDHRLAFNLVAMLSVKIPILFTDICFYDNCHMSSDAIPAIYQHAFYDNVNNKLGDFELNIGWYSRMVEIYKKHNAWTWDGHGPVHRAGLYYSM